MTPNFQNNPMEPRPDAPGNPPAGPMAGGVDWSMVRYFSRAEWGPLPELVASDLISALDEARHLAGVPVHVHESWADKGHEKGSMHYLGRAVDFHFAPGLGHVEEFSLLSSFLDFGAIGFYPEWAPRPGWHVDTRAVARRVVWVGINRVYRYGWRELARALEMNR